MENRNEHGERMHLETGMQKTSMWSWNGIKMFYFLSDGFTFVVFFSFIICLRGIYSIWFCVYQVFHRKKKNWKGHQGLTAPLYLPEYTVLCEQHSDLCGWPPSEVGSCLRHQESQCWNHA